MITQVKKWVTDHPVWFAILFFIFYFTGFFTLEHLVTEPVYLLHCRLDDLIPFNEWFIFPYASWFGLIPWALITLLLFDRKNYFYLCGVMFSGMALCLLLYLIFPNGVDLRPQSIESNNLAATFVRMIWSADTSTNVCPSIHVASTFAIFLAVQRSRIWKHRKLVVGICGVLTVMICLSTLFLKQHSVIDVVCGIALSPALHFVFRRTGEREKAVLCRLGENEG